LVFCFFFYFPLLFPQETDVRNNSNVEHICYPRYRYISNISTGDFLTYLPSTTDLVESKPLSAGNQFLWKLIILRILHELETNGK
jgi:hypothetical protein